MKKINIRFPDDIHEKLKQMAIKDKRSLNMQVLHLIEEAPFDAEGENGNLRRSN